MNRKFIEWGVASAVGVFASRSNVDLRVLMYHRVDEPQAKPHLDQCTLSATPSSFEQQMDYVSKHHCVVSITDVLDAIDGKNQLPSRAVLITFDDAYDCFARNAWPILKSKNLPALLFVPTSYPGNRQNHFWWDVVHRLVYDSSDSTLETSLGSMAIVSPDQKRDAHSKLTRWFESAPAESAKTMVEELAKAHALERYQNDVMPWRDLSSLVEQGLHLGAHTHTHPLLNKTNVSNAEIEIATSVSEILKHTGYHAETLAYPGGGHNNQTIEVARRIGLKAAFTTCRGANDIQNISRFQIRRINVGKRATINKLKAQLLLRRAFFNRWFPLQDSD